MSLPHRPVAVVFDMDGLLFDTEALWQAALLAAAAQAGHTIPDAVYAGAIGVRRSQCGPLFRAHFGEAFAFETFHADWRRHFWRLADDGGLALKPGVLALLDTLDDLSLPRAIATSSSRATVDRHLATHGLTHRFHPLICRGDYAAGKPAPDPFLTAAERLSVEPRLCLALEDSHIGVRSAAAAGMMTVMVPDLMPATDDIRALGVRVARDLGEVRAMIPHSRDVIPSSPR